MKRFVTPLVAFVGASLVLVGFWWTWTGLDIVQIERGWSAVIAGATMLSAGFVVLVLAAILKKLDEIAVALKTGGRSSHDLSDGSEDSAADWPRPLGTPVSNDEAQPAEKEIVGKHVSGDATYTMFADGSVEAQTLDGTMNFASLEDLRAYADERAAIIER